MLKHIYPEQIASNVAYSLIGKRAIAGKRLHDLSSYTVIIIADELEDEVLIKNIADDILTRGCRNIAYLPFQSIPCLLITIIQLMRSRRRELHHPVLGI